MAAQKDLDYRISRLEMRIADAEWAKQREAVVETNRAKKKRK